MTDRREITRLRRALAAVKFLLDRIDDRLTRLENRINDHRDERHREISQIRERLSAVETRAADTRDDVTSRHRLPKARDSERPAKRDGLAHLVALSKTWAPAVLAVLALLAALVNAILRR